MREIRKCFVCFKPITQKKYVMLQAMQVVKVKKFRVKHLIEVARPIPGSTAYRHLECGIDPTHS